MRGAPEDEASWPGSHRSASSTNGSPTARFQRVENFLLPLVSALMPIPSFALVPLFMLWFGIGNTTTVLIVLSEGFHRQPFIDLAIILAVLSVVGSLAFARIMESDI
jgi:ABC-type dipeptide/oligopeptide/nickel transport system permease subunit